MPGLLKLILCIHVYVHPLLTSGVIWSPDDWLNKFYNIYVGALVSIILRHGLSIDMHHENQLNKCKLALYTLSIHFNSSLNQLYISSKIEHFSYKGGCGVMCIEAFKRRASFGCV